MTSISTIRTWGWFPSQGGGGNTSISSIRTWGWFFDDDGGGGVIFLNIPFKIPVEHTQLLKQNNNIPVGHLGLLEGNNRLPTETLGGAGLIGDDSQIPVELISSFASDAGSKILVENVSSLLDAGNIPVEKLAGVIRNNNILTEILGGIRREGKIPVETISNLNLVVSTEIPIENVALLFQEAGVPVEILTDTVLITGEKQIPIEHLAGVLSDNQIPVEVFREVDGSIWALDRRGVLWEVDSRQVLWDIINCGVVWIRKD